MWAETISFRNVTEWKQMTKVDSNQKRRDVANLEQVSLACSKKGNANKMVLIVKAIRREHGEKCNRIASLQKGRSWEPNIGRSYKDLTFLGRQ